jgi:flagellar assembly protein FliH
VDSSGAFPDSAFESAEELPLQSWPEREAALKQVYERGFAEGYAKAQEDGEEEYTRRLEAECTMRMQENGKQVAQLIDGVHTAWKQLNSNAESMVITLAMAAAEQIVKEEIQTNPNVVLRQIHEGLKRLNGVERLTLRLHPDDEKIVRQYKNELLASSDSVREITITGDDTIKRGGCILESDSGNVDATMESQSKKILDVLTQDRIAYK